MKRTVNIIIRKSCLTGKAMWIYTGASIEGAKNAYKRARRAEMERVSKWAETTVCRMENIKRLLNDCLSELPINAQLTPQQLKAVKELQTIARQSINGCSEFYNHVVETNRRRRQNMEIRRKMRER